MEAAKQQTYITLRASEAATQCIVIAPVSVCVCLFVGPPYYSQRAVFASPLSAFFINYVINKRSKFMNSIVPFGFLIQ